MSTVYNKDSEFEFRIKIHLFRVSNSDELNYYLRSISQMFTTDYKHDKFNFYI